MGRDDYTAMGRAEQAFRTTHWSLIEGVHASEEEESRILISLLMERYWKPVYCYLRGKGYNNEAAKDLTQGFFHEVVLERHLVEDADAAKGRFRTFLLIALDRYVAKVHEKQTAQKRMPRGKLVPLEIVESSDLLNYTTGETPEDTFNYAWVSALLEQVLAQVEAKCCEDGKALHWRVFRERVLQPIVNRTTAPDLGSICARLGIASTAVASNMIVTVKRRFRVAFRRQLRNSVIADQYLEEEIDAIRRFLPEIAQEPE
jgi:RNA polymerase sigma-70 factor (ECF subfamily)